MIGTRKGLLLLINQLIQRDSSYYTQLQLLEMKIV